MKSVIIADNHPLIRAGVRQLIEAHDEYQLVDEAGDCESCLFKVRELKPDLLLLDLNMPDTGGFDVVRKLNAQGSRSKVVILSMYASKEFVDTARELNCAGFVAKEDAGSELVLALDNLANGFQMSSSVGRGEPPLTAPGQPDRRADFDASLLTRTELLVLAGIANSSTSQAIAEDMGTSPRTVETHRQNISRKLELSGANSLVRFASENKKVISAELARMQRAPSQDNNSN